MSITSCSKYNTYHWCLVRECKNTSLKTPQKLWIQLPNDIKMRRTWLKLARRDPKSLSTKTRLYFCEDHFDLEHDMENYTRYKIMGSVKRIRMRKNCVPLRFECQNKSVLTNRKYKFNPSEPRHVFIKKQRMSIVKDIKDNTENENDVVSLPSCTQDFFTPELKCENEAVQIEQTQDSAKDRVKRSTKKRSIASCLKYNNKEIKDNTGNENNVVTLPSFSQDFSTPEIKCENEAVQVEQALDSTKDRVKKSSKKISITSCLKYNNKEIKDNAGNENDVLLLPSFSQDFLTPEIKCENEAVQAPDTAKDRVTSKIMSITSCLNYNRYHWCMVRECKNTSLKTPEKLWIQLPTDIKMRRTWLKLARRDPKSLSTKTRLYFCEDHFDLENDMENYTRYKIMGSVKRIRMRPNCVPSRFDCQTNRKLKPTPCKPRHAFIKRQRMSIIKEIEDNIRNENDVSLPFCNQDILTPEIKCDNEAVQVVQTQEHSAIQVCQMQNRRSRNVQSSMKTKGIITSPLKTTVRTATSPLKVSEGSTTKFCASALLAAKRKLLMELFKDNYESDDSFILGM